MPTAPPPGQNQAELEKTKALFQRPQQGATVSAAMPTAPPMTTIQGAKQYDENAFQLEKDSIPQTAPAQEGVYDASGNAVQGNHFFTPQELQQLQSQPLPVDAFRPTNQKDESAVNMPTVQGVQVVQAGQAQTVTANPIMVTAAGVPIVTNAVSGARTWSSSCMTHSYHFTLDKQNLSILISSNTFSTNARAQGRITMVTRV